MQLHSREACRTDIAFGRSSDNDVVLRDFSVSRHHAKVEEKDGELHLVDLESTNGIRINEEFVASGAFSLGDLLGVDFVRHHQHRLAAATDQRGESLAQSRVFEHLGHDRHPARDLDGGPILVVLALGAIARQGGMPSAASASVSGTQSLIASWQEPLRPEWPSWMAGTAS